uniref:ER membrane protein complex subunit 1 n=1 Tax=Clastoptera arizonana TaxID=38151 RepID=A0A1B6DQ56_9HEMI
MNKKFAFTLLVFSIFQLGRCLYEDQIGKFDWKQNYLGKLKFSRIDSKSAIKRIVVATEENIVASLALRTGDIAWRHILERGDQGIIQLLHTDSEVVTVAGTGPFIVREWSINSGFLINEWTIQSEKSDKIKWAAYQRKLYQINIKTTKSIDIIVYSINSNAQVTSYSLPVDAADISGFVLSGLNIFYITSSGKLASLSILGGSEVLQMELPGPVTNIDSVDSSNDISSISLTINNKKIVVAKVGNSLKVLQYDINVKTGLSVQTLPNDDYFLLESQQTKGSLDITGTLFEGGTPNYQALSGRASHNFSLADADISSALCVSRKDKTVACQMLLSAEDSAIVFVHTPDKVIWVREEALASIITTDTLDLPVSDIEAAIEKEFDNKENSCFGMFIRRVASQLMQLQSFILSLVNLRGLANNAEGRADLVRDQFGLHKMIVAVTSVGKIFGIDNFSGETVWQVLLKDVVPYITVDKPHIPFYVQRTTRFFPLPAQCSLLFKHKVTGEGVLYVFDPITGLSLDGDMVRLGYHVKQTLLLHILSEDSLKGIVLIDDKNQVHIYPESTKSAVLEVAKSTYFFLADPSVGDLTGYTLSYSTNEKLISTPIWEVKLNQKITHVVGKNSIEKVHSQGRVLGDRSVLYKYINPNLIAVATQIEDPIHKNVLSVYLIDAVSGSIIFSTVQKRATEPIHIVHSENWLVYSYFSDKTRRTEVATFELYEGKVQSNTTAFSSMSSLMLPMVERQAYILPAGVEAMKETITEKGITSKHVLVALNNGGVLEVPWMFLDPRRSVTITPELREEGVIPYIPELPVPAEAIINYNQTMLRVRGIHTAPSGLESTCLVFVYGLDLFYTRVAPSKTFDMLKEDFDFALITVVLLALSISAYVTKKLSSRKALNQAWK